MRHTDQAGFGLIGAVILSSGLLILTMAFTVQVLAAYRFEHRNNLEARALYIAEAGIESAIFNLNKAGSTYTGETISFALNSTVTTTVATSGSDKIVTATGTVPSGITPLIRKIRVTLTGTPSTQASFYYGVQVGAGGISMSNSSKIIGNAYSGGNATASNTASIVGDLYVTGATGTISGFTVSKSGTSAVDGNAHAHTITGATIARDAYYQTISSSTVGGTSHPGSTDPAATGFAITPSQITGWESDAAAGGTQAGNLTVSSGTTNLGPKKITGNLVVSGGTLNLTGTLYVTGTISVSGTGIIQVDPSFDTNGTELISDGTISLSNSALIRGSGDPKSYLLTITNSSANPAVTISNSSKNDILFAPNGWVQLNNSNNIRSVTAYGLSASNAATITYDQGLANASFSSGPGGRWTVSSWQKLR